MCGRFVITAPEEAIAEWFDAEIRVGFEGSRFNIAPSQMIPVVVEYEGTRLLSEMRWGFIPHWYKTPNDGPFLINARGETAHEKPSFRTAFAKRRCIIPASGFYEWHEKKGVGKEPYFIHASSGDPMGFAGLWQVWTHPTTQDRWVTVAIVTTQASAQISDIHHREPVTLQKNEFDPWLRGTPADARQVINAADEGYFMFHRVDRAVNSARHDSEELMAPLIG
ncbi:MAG: SOS response-associated peptidase [Pseudomonadota bacterium]